MTAGAIRVGIGGWTYAPWRGVFYPPGLPHARELAHAAARVTTIEINGTYYGTQSPKTFASWAQAVPDGFLFSLKASRYATNRRVLAEADESVAKFLNQGLTELGDRLGPILWQFMPTKAFDADDFGAFLTLLPATLDGLRLRHAVEVRHESFRDPAFVALARAHGVAIVIADAEDHPQFADLSSDFVYARLQNAREAEPAGYPPAELDRWTATARDWAAGKAPAGLSYIDADQPAATPRDVFLFMINGAKVRAPAAAEAMLGRLNRAP